jgi:hypothetical protein
MSRFKLPHFDCPTSECLLYRIAYRHRLHNPVEEYKNQRDILSRQEVYRTRLSERHVGRVERAEIQYHGGRFHSGEW